MWLSVPFPRCPQGHIWVGSASRMYNTLQNPQGIGQMVPLQLVPSLSGPTPDRSQPSAEASAASGAQRLVVKYRHLAPDSREPL